ncbi:hypothetical protein CPB84DRAFT_161222 [Gymnopilus junonius]|uniref:Uncharacterized protein n=1 Tax=Gymnopilus junonius TaxID=109634 RepID=A0A9P5NTW2_GYMJU|nr:hypothetical protein CPB84DRAFT_161222 [Gymnopilus junonius]
MDYVLTPHIKIIARCSKIPEGGMIIVLVLLCKSKGCKNTIKIDTLWNKMPGHRGGMSNSNIECTEGRDLRTPYSQLQFATIMISKSFLFTLAPELFETIAEHLPLHCRSPSLLSLALTNHSYYDIVYSLLIPCLMLRNEDDSINVLQRILPDKQFSRAVRQLHIMSELSLAAANGEKPFDTITGLKKAVTTGSLSRIHTLSLRVCYGWIYHPFTTYFSEGFDRLDKNSGKN